MVLIRGDLRMMQTRIFATLAVAAVAATLSHSPWAQQTQERTKLSNFEVTDGALEGADDSLSAESPKILVLLTSGVTGDIFLRGEGLKTEQRDWNVSDGRIEKAAGNRLMTQSKEMRATLKRNTPQQVIVNFAYLGPSREVSRLGSGEIRHQFGIKLKAQDICNLVYVMWNFDTQRIAVSVKTNPGQRTHEECLDRGYINNIRAELKTDPPALRVDEPHILAADLDGQELKVTVDGREVWRGTLPAMVLQFHGPVGLRSDNVQVVFDYFVDPS